MVFTLITGWVVDHYSYMPVFIGFGILPLISATIIWTLVGPLTKSSGTCRAGKSRPCSDVSVEHLLYVGFSDRADLLIDHFPALEYQQRGNSANLVAARGLNI